MARLEDDFMGRQAKEVIEKQAEIITKDSQELVIILEADNFNNLHTALKRRVIIEAIGLLRGHVQDISFKNIEQILALACQQGESRRLQPCQKVLISRQKDRILFINLAYADSLPRKYRAIFEHRPLTYWLDKVDGSIKNLEGFGVNIKARIMDKPEKKLYRSAKGFEAFMDYDKIRFPVKIRNWEKGDRFSPLGPGA
ncbi:MAG: hypothetical protein U5N58_07365 [Actinomycetota bacterium]|nr:hypothetical protein [Actinomycetota bacterium]